jgi:iron-sulfur cluster insertion protein
MNAVTDAVAEMPVPLVFSDGAANKVKQLIEEEGNPELKLRVFVTGGGCSGFQYGFTFEGLEGAQFVIKNPNAQSTCGCGSSFSV